MPSFTHVQTVTTRWFLNGTTPSLSVPSTGAGNILVMMVSAPNHPSTSSLPTYTFPSGWTKIDSPFDNQYPQMSVAYYVTNPGGITSVQVSHVVSSEFTHVCFMEFAPSVAASFDNDGTSQGTGTGSMTAANALAGGSELVVGFASLKAFNETGSPTFDSGFTGIVVEHDSSTGGSTYAEYNLSTAVGNISISPSAGTSDAWRTFSLAFSVPTPQRALTTGVTPSTTEVAVYTPHSSNWRIGQPPTTQLNIGHSYSRAMLTAPKTKIRFEAGGYSPRTIPMSAVFATPVRVIPQAATLDFEQHIRNIPEKAIFVTPDLQRTIPQSVCFSFIHIPQSAVFLEGKIKRTIPQQGVFNIQTRYIPQHAVFIPTTSGKRVIPQTIRTAIQFRIIHQHAVFIPTTSGKRIIPQHGLFVTQEANVQRTIHQRAIFQPILVNLRRIIPQDGTFLASPERVIPQHANLLKARVIPMTVQSPLIGKRFIRMSVSVSRVYTRLIIEDVVLGVLDAERVIPMDSLFGISATRTIPQHANLVVIITSERTIPQDVVLERLNNLIQIPQRALLGGDSLSWIICQPRVGIAVCPGMSTG